MTAVVGQANGKGRIGGIGQDIIEHRTTGAIGLDVQVFGIWGVLAEIRVGVGAAGTEIIELNG